MCNSIPNVCSVCLFIVLFIVIKLVYSACPWLVISIYIFILYFLFLFSYLNCIFLFCTKGTPYPNFVVHAYSILRCNDNKDSNLILIFRTIGMLAVQTLGSGDHVFQKCLMGPLEVRRSLSQSSFKRVRKTKTNYSS